MERYDLIGKDGNAYAVMGYVCRAMKDAYREANTPDEDGQVDEVAKKLFDKAAQDAYTKDAMSSDYNHLLCVSMDMLDKVNEWFENQAGFEGWDEEDDYEDDYYDDEEEED
jgi:methionyl-tRNA synthetase